MKTRERIVLLLFTLFNIIANRFIALHSDETYYWFWSKKLDWSYVDHPPMVAYLIKATTFFGDDPMWIRLAAPLMMSGSAYILYKLSKKMFDEKTAIYAFYIFLSALVVQGGSTLITPDIPMTFFWIATLYCAYIFIAEEDKKYALLTGIFAGMLLLSKYTGVLLLVSLVIYILLYKRSLLKDRYLYFAILLALIVFSPVIYWNYLHDFISFKFQLGHGIAEEKVFQPNLFFNFLGAQLILFHPFYLIPLLYFIIRDKQRFTSKKMFLLVPFLFPFGFFIYFAAFKYANAQWAAPAFLSASILLGYYLAAFNGKKLIVYAAAFTAVLVIMVKTPLGNFITPVEKLKIRLGKIDNFTQEIKALDLDMDSYDYLLIENYKSTDIAHHFGMYKNVLVLSTSRFSNFQIWRHDELGIGLGTSLLTLPKLGKCLFIGNNIWHVQELKNLFGNAKQLGYEEKMVGGKMMHYYFVEYNN